MNRNWSELEPILLSKSQIQTNYIVRLSNDKKPQDKMKPRERFSAINTQIDRKSDERTASFKHIEQSA